MAEAEGSGGGEQPKNVKIKGTQLDSNLSQNVHFVKCLYNARQEDLFS